MGQYFKNIFYALEENKVLDVDNLADIWTLHQVFLLVISKVLNKFYAL